MSGPTTLLIDRGDLPSLALLGIQPDSEQIVLWHPRQDGEKRHSPRREAVARRHAELFGVELFVHEFSPLPTEREAPARIFALRELTEAGFAAAARGCARLLSPRQIGREHVKVSEALQQALEVTRLLEVGADDQRLIIDLPLVDLTDIETLELADDAGMALDQHWPCDHGGNSPCGTCPSCERWQRVFNELGIPWPWSERTHPQGHTSTSPCL